MVVEHKLDESEKDNGGQLKYIFLGIAFSIDSHSLVYRCRLRSLTIVYVHHCDGSR